MKMSIEDRRYVFGRWLGQRREAAHLTQKGLAERLGTTTLLIELTETGHNCMPPSLYEKWRRYVDVDPPDFYKRMLWVVSPPILSGLYPEERPQW
jgi:transcriptional regulator with XRE-family HTH domain